MKKQSYYTIDRYGHIKKDRFMTYINSQEWVMPVVVILLMLACGFIEGGF